MHSPARWRRRITGPDVVAGAVFAVAGAMFVASSQAGGTGDIRLDPTGGLREAIADRAAEVARLQGTVDGLADRVEAIRAQDDPAPALARTQAQVAGISPLVGLTEVVGPGVTVVLDDADAPDEIPPGRTGDDYVVHQQDVQGVVNALWRGGAAGITVMGQRLSSTSAVRCVGNTVILQGRVYSPPFVIEAVGDVRALESSLGADLYVQIFRDLSREIGLGYQQRSSGRLVLPAYAGPLAPQYADAS